MICKKLFIPFIHISSDYVFDGKKGKPYFENDFPNPINYYGLSKLSAEKGILSLNSNNIILRTSWVYSNSKNNFLSKIISKANKYIEVNVVYDQFGSPTSAKDIANTCILIS